MTAIGDNYNDEMLEFTGVSVIMANACDELKQDDRMITLENKLTALLTPSSR
jgi:hydroxymethylpyrimidine pyrophosphatase-like HAD family hydrolase